MKLPTVPILEFDSAKNAVIDPKKVYRKKDIPPRCVVCFFQEVLEGLVREERLTQIACLKSELGAHPVYALDAFGEKVTVFHPGVGAPLATTFLEEVIALGGQKFIACGGAGALKETLDVGQLFVPYAAIRDEGTSYHYLPPAREVLATEEGVLAIKRVLESHDIPYQTGKTWTTDAIYRETEKKVKRRREEGCFTVEMEAAAFFAVAQFRKVCFAQILYSGDDVSQSEWDERQWDSHTIRQTLFWLAVEACLSL